MGVHTTETKTYFQVGANGDIRLTVPEGTAGAVRREYEDRETKELKHKFELIYSFIDGMVGDITIMQGKFGDNLIIPLKDVVSGETLYLALGVTSSYGEDFLKKMPSIDHSKPVVITPFSFTSDKGRLIKGVDVKQNGEKVKNFFRGKKEGSDTEENINGLPNPEGDTKGYSKDDWKIYFLTVRKFLINYNKEKGFIKDRAASSTPLVVSDSPHDLLPVELGGDAIPDDVAGEEVPF